MCASCSLHRRVVLIRERAIDVAAPPYIQTQERLKRKSALIRASMKEGAKQAMARAIVILRAGPSKGAEPPRQGRKTKDGAYRAPPTQEGWLAWATPHGTSRRFYRLVGGYLVRYADEEASRGAPFMDDDGGLDCFERFMEAQEERAQNVFTCWRLCREHKEASEFPDTQTLMLKLEKRLVEDFLSDEGRLPEGVASEARLECVQATKPHGLNTMPVGAIRAACVAELHALTYDAFKNTDDYKEFCTSKKDPGEPVGDGQRVLIYAPTDPAALKERLQKMPKCATKLKALQVVRNGQGKRIYEAWTSLKYDPEHTRKVLIGRDHKWDVAVDDDKRVSREHARIDSLKDGRVVFLDLGSSHGSKVNGKTVAGRVYLSVGDVIHVGKTEVIFTVIPSGTENPLR